MNSTKIIVAGLIGFVVSFLLGWGIYGVLMADFFAANSGGATNVARPEEEMVFWALILANLSYGFLIAIIFGAWANIKGFAAGAKTGAIINFLMAGFFDFIMYGTTTIGNLNATVADIAIGTVIGAIVGGVVGWYYGRGE